MDQRPRKTVEAVVLIKADSVKTKLDSAMLCNYRLSAKHTKPPNQSALRLQMYGGGACT